MCNWKLYTIINYLNMQTVADLSPKDIKYVMSNVISKLETTILHEILRLRDGLIKNKNRLSNTKFGNTFEGNYGKIQDFHLEDNDSPNTDWENGMSAEHLTAGITFITPNFNIDTTPRKE